MLSAKEKKTLEAAYRVFLSYGFKRVTMHEIAEAAGISRPALYLMYRSKEEVFSAVVRQNMELACQAIEHETALLASKGEQLRRAIDMWVVQPFEKTLSSPEAKELMESSHLFAQEAFELGNQRFEALITRFLPDSSGLPPEVIAHILTSALQGFKKVSPSKAALEALLADLLLLCRL